MVHWVLWRSTLAVIFLSIALARSVRFAHASLSLRIRAAHDGARADT